MECDKCKFSENFDRDGPDRFDCKLRPKQCWSQWRGGRSPHYPPVCLLHRYSPNNGAYENTTPEIREYLKNEMGIDMDAGTWTYNGQIIQEGVD